VNKQQELVARWDNFLFKIEQRFQESAQQGEQAVLDSLEENGYDYYVSIGALYAIKSQINESLLIKIDDTWRNQVEPAMRTDGDYWVDEMHKGYNLNEQLHEQISLWLFVTEGKLSKKYYDYAIGLVNKNFYCTQCNSPIQIKNNFFKSHYITCQFCNTVNTFEPSTKYAQIGGNVIDNIAAFSAFDEYVEMRKASKIGGIKYKAAYRIYLEKYFQERIKLLPETEATYDEDMALEMRKNFTD
jgi:hypothetical protein